MDKKRSILNVSIAIITKVILLIFSLLLRRLLINNVGNDVNGLYSLYTSIISFLSIAELGVGTAINFSMYKPIVQGDTKKVAALYNLYKKVYLVVGAVVLIVGAALMPALPALAKDYSNSANLYLTFGIMLASVVIDYAYSSKTSLINAHKNNYVTTLISSFCIIFRRVIQLLVLIFLHSFEYYLLAKVLASLVEWGLVEIYTRRHYKDVISLKDKVDQETKNEVVKNTKAMFLHKMSGILVNATDSIIISAFIGVVVLGKYSNYLTVMTAMTSILTLFFTPLTAIIGHLCAEGNLSEKKKYFRFMYFFNFTIGIIFFLGYYAVIDDLIAIMFGADLVMDWTVPLIITINYFIQFMRQTVLLYRDATGSFYYDRWQPVISAVLNIILSLLFVKWFGVVGVIVATIVTNLFVTHLMNPYVLYKYGFDGEKPTKYYLLNYGLILVFCGALAVLHFVMQTNSNLWIEFVINGFIAVGIAFVPIVCLLVFSKTYRENTKKLLKKAIGLFKRKKLKTTSVSDFSCENNQNLTENVEQADEIPQGENDENDQS